MTRKERDTPRAKTTPASEPSPEAPPTGDVHPEAPEVEEYARAHPAGYLATRAAAEKTERVGHPATRDDPGYGAYGRRTLSDEAREFYLRSPVPGAQPPAAQAEEPDADDSPAVTPDADSTR